MKISYAWSNKTVFLSFETFALQKLDLLNEFENTTSPSFGTQIEMSGKLNQN